VKRKVAKLIVVHQVHGAEELLLNCEQIVQALTSKSRQDDYTTVKMVGGDSHSIKESLTDLIGLST